MITWFRLTLLGVIVGAVGFCATVSAEQVEFAGASSEICEHTDEDCLTYRRLLLPAAQEGTPLELFHSTRRLVCPTGKADDAPQLAVLRAVSFDGWTLDGLGAVLSGVESCGQLPVWGLSADALFADASLLGTISDVAARKGAPVFALQSDGAGLVRDALQRLADAEEIELLFLPHAAGTGALQPGQFEALGQRVPPYRELQQ